MAQMNAPVGRPAGSQKCTEERSTERANIILRDCQVPVGLYFEQSFSLI